ncbi:hypothetical protein Gbro_4039 [Gordonia bronchialis DSM 43247]|jgi:hypothetical protein|uniref:Secreted protein n=1 Tax=Gordonia bronchialis (strain ATCC 25592 / DSM 43247 / BCRC 13721 / JCM 3198 / KCTC 3076 / NBRC 16047 / NCTC 10667) TaxID=526226 RepID=D0L4I1_GORB4|nr:hypothetical protein [Gordonia bronchialis]ACY23206.1 hypothetical protein Gbro_4039 [Gordonia bronchialis DSM 43247]MCC3325991.1 hypothetical protein [Gordonia bronchialis]QGS23393.1 hypothetical protein FOB84_03605 [Gordonia bronchialis]UAK36248.1 hypothetical protein K8O93_12915 [Gordonia bronchialis]STQ66173.1 Uncharacterised protein [Gordonia bronchialis]
MSVLKRATTAVLVAAGIAAGTVAGTAPSQAAAPGDLQIQGNVECHFGQWGQPWNKAWYMYRYMTVRNVGGSTMHNVTLQEINGRSVFIKELKPGQTMSKWSARENRWVRPIETRWTGCWPSSITGYTIGAEAENLTNNFGYWQNWRRADNPPQGNNTGN